MNDLWKFEIGDWVQWKLPHPYNSLNHKGEIIETRLQSLPALVVSRVLEECPGGNQRHYHVRPMHAVSADWGGITMRTVPADKLMTANEVELELYEPIKFEKKTD